MDVSKQIQNLAREANSNSQWKSTQSTKAIQKLQIAVKAMKNSLCRTKYKMGV